MRISSRGHKTTAEPGVRQAGVRCVPGRVGPEKVPRLSGQQTSSLSSSLSLLCTGFPAPRAEPRRRHAAADLDPP